MKKEGGHDFQSLGGYLKPLRNKKNSAARICSKLNLRNSFHFLQSVDASLSLFVIDGSATISSSIMKLSSKLLFRFEKQFFDIEANH